MKHKKRTKKHHPLNRFMHGNILIPLLFIIVAFGVLLTSGSLVNKSATDTKEQFGEATVASGSGQKNLQLKDLTFSKKPTPATDVCNHDMHKKIIDMDACQCIAQVVNCVQGSCVDYKPEKSTPKTGTKEEICSEFNRNRWCQLYGNEGDGWYCIGKPVIYLYPEKPTLVNVTVKTAGKIVVSDPLYPNEGWQNVLAHPDGTLLYQNQNYRELFYESKTSTLSQPKAGIVMPKQNLKEDLRAFITRLGLTKNNEQKEFLDWWLPQLNALDSPYIFVSILERQEKERLDKVEISPKPDTFIDFIVYFRPLNSPIGVQPLNLPDAPKRTGFTAIEWGGVIGK